MIDDFAYPTTESRLIALQLGALCIEWSQIDHTLGLLLGHYMKFPYSHFDLAVGHIDFSRKCELSGALSFLYDERGVYNKLNRALKFIDNDLRPIRNRYVHDSYSFFTGDNLKRVFKAKVINVQSYTKELITRTESKVSSAEVSQFNKDIHVCGAYLISHLIGRMAVNTGASPEFMDAATKVGEEAYSELSAVIERYRSAGVNAEV